MIENEIAHRIVPLLTILQKNNPKMSEKVKISTYQKRPKLYRKG
jgi:hypothetical protein